MEQLKKNIDRVAEKLGYDVTEDLQEAELRPLLEAAWKRIEHMVKEFEQAPGIDKRRNEELTALRERLRKSADNFEAAVTFIESIKAECSKITGNKFDGKKAEGCVFFIETGIGLFMNEVRKMRLERKE